MTLRVWMVAAVFLGMWSGCKPAAKESAGEEASSGGERAIIARLDPPTSNPPERDDSKAPLLRVELRGSPSSPVPVPFLYGYPLYAEGPALQGVQLLRQDNWTGYMRQDEPQPDGVMKVVESFPALGCTFEGIQEDESHYVPLNITCDVPLPRERGEKRPIVGDVAANAKLAVVEKEPSLQKAFLGEWHAKGDGFDSGEGEGYFDTPHGLLGFGFRKGKLNRVQFVFDTAEKRWRKPELWQAPSTFVVGQ